MVGMEMLAVFVGMEMIVAAGAAVRWIVRGKSNAKIGTMMRFWRYIAVGLAGARK